MHKDTYSSELRVETCDRLISFASAREMVGVSRSKIYQMLEQKAFPRPVKVGRSNFFSEYELQRWIRSQLANRNSTNVES